MEPSNQPPRGDFVAFINRDKQPGDNRPAFEGRISKPGSDDKLAVSLWAHEYQDPKTGEIKVMFSGYVDAISTNVSAADQISALVDATPNVQDATLGNLTLKPRQVVLFPNGFKDEAPHKKRPDYWGGTNFGDGSPISRNGVWLKTDKAGRAYLSGATSYPLPGKSEAEQQAAEPDLHDLIEAGKVSKGMPKKGKGRGE